MPHLCGDSRGPGLGDCAACAICRVLATASGQQLSSVWPRGIGTRQMLGRAEHVVRLR